MSGFVAAYTGKITVQLGEKSVTFPLYTENEPGKPFKEEVVAEHVVQMAKLAVKAVFLKP